MSERDFIFWLRGFLETKQSETIDTIKSRLATVEPSAPLYPWLQPPQPGVVPAWPGPSEYHIPPGLPGELPYRITCNPDQTPCRPDAGGSGGHFTSPGIMP